MNLKELADFGFSLADEVNRTADEVPYEKREELLTNAQNIKTKADELLRLLETPEILAKIEGSELLQMFPKLPELTTFIWRLKQFEQIAEVVLIFADTKRNWKNHYREHYQKYDQIWETINEGLEYPQEKQRIMSEEARREEEDLTLEFTNDLPAVEETDNSAHPIPCFANSLENGLNCNQNDLIKLKIFPTFFSDNRKIDVSIKKCSQCGQLYKEVFEVNETTKEILHHFLKPNETDINLGFHFSNSETEEFNHIDFGDLVNPNSEKTETISEISKQSNRAFYEEKLSINRNLSLESFIRVLFPYFRDYGVVDSKEETYLRKNNEGVITNRTEVIGNLQGAHLKHDYCNDYSYGGDGFSGSHGYEKLRSFNLIHSVTGQKLDLSIEIDLLTYSSFNDVRIYFEGEADEVEKFKNIVKPLFADS